MERLIPAETSFCTGTSRITRQHETTGADHLHVSPRGSVRILTRQYSSQLICFCTVDVVELRLLT
ncbi:B-cell scaffold protein with ankyrin repeat, partial [Clarias magur]